jgi:hypothetical protein
MAITRTESKRSSARSAAASKKEADRNGSREPAVLKLAAIGKIRRQDIRRAVLAVRHLGEENMTALASVEA